MIDLRKAGLLNALLRLPYSFVMPDTLFEDEWLCLTDAEKSTLCGLGLDVRSLPGPLVQRASSYFNQHARLKLNDCFALTLAEETEDCILLTGDGPLRRIAESKRIEVRGVLWVTDELEIHELVPAADLLAALQRLNDDDLVFLPSQEILKRIRHLSRLV
ncbi:MAG: hypothetical protein NPIRA02_02540 [Nitrospirales bacterium]|nr:MAG: hypothetical protein NPIRA02_02540 [Nitrospirales bacterium]